MFSDGAERRPVVVEARLSAPHSVDAILVAEVGADVDESEEDTVLGKAFDVANSAGGLCSESGELADFFSRDLSCGGCDGVYVDP